MNIESKNSADSTSHALIEGSADDLISHSMVEVNGAQLHVARAGRGRPLLLLHGWPEFWYTWHPMMVQLATSFELIAPDLRGFGGDSDKPVGDFGPEDQASDMAELIKKLDVCPVGIVSHDVGASVAQVLARHHPKLVAGLFFFNFVYPGISDRFYEPNHLNYVWHTFFNQSELAAPLLRSSPDAVGLYIRYFVRLWAHHPEAFDEAMLEKLVANLLKSGNIEGGSTWYRTAAAQRAKEAKGGEQPTPIHLPTRVRWTECDKSLKIEWTDRLGDFFTDLDFKPFADAGHFPHHEQPDRAAHEIAEFFSQLREQRWKRPNARSHAETAKIMSGNHKRPPIRTALLLPLLA